MPSSTHRTSTRNSSAERSSATTSSPPKRLAAGDLVRYRLPLDGGDAERRDLRHDPLEFPTIHFPTIHYRRRVGREHRYVYAAETHGGSSLPTDLVKVDLETWRARTRGEPGSPPASQSRAGAQP